MNTRLLLLLLLLLSAVLQGQRVKDFFFLEEFPQKTPVLVRGDLTNNTILLFLSGGYGENGLDFARADYPKWRKTLEQSVAIAYYDKYGLNTSVRKVDSTAVSWDAHAEEVWQIIGALKEKYRARILLIGHSAGGHLGLHFLSRYSDKAQSGVAGAIMLNTPYTQDSSPERYTNFRPAYLKNLAQDYVAEGKSPAFWQEAYEWMEATGEISTREDSKQWNAYVDQAFTPAKRKIGPGMILRTLFARPYNPISYLYQKDNKLVGDLLWEEAQTWTKEKFDLKLERINHPVLLITGRYDPIAVPEEMLAFQSHLTNLRTVILPECGHEPFLDQPEFLNQQILQFIFPGGKDQYD